MAQFKLPSVAEREAFIRQTAIEEGINPDIAVRVARSEGLRKGVWQSNAKARYGREESYGDLQLHMSHGRAGYDPGLGDEMLAKTGIDPSDPANWQEADRYALKHAAQYGWGAWEGAKKVGIRGKMGITGKKGKQGVSPEAAPIGMADAKKAAPEGDDVEYLPDEPTPDEPEYADYPAEESAEDMPDVEPPAADEEESKGKAAAGQLVSLGQNMMANDDSANFDYTPAGDNQFVEAPVESGIPIDQYQQYTNQVFAQEGGAIEDFNYDPEQFDYESEMDPNDFLAEMLGIGDEEDDGLRE